MQAKLLTQAVGPWPMNTYVVICEETKTSAIIDPGADAEKILALTEGTRVDKILLTHGHFDHVQALERVQEATNAPVYLHPADAQEFGLAFDVALEGGQQIPVGNLVLKAIHTPGHTPGQICFDLGDGRIVVGDTIFVGGPGKTWSPEDFNTTMKTMQETVFIWPDETQFFPGHGLSGVIGVESPAFENFIARGWPHDLQGDVTWE
ncbi:MAG: MBL fold metallo-hydrolase [Chloroflexi bacterium]|nr:MBL fold metallo-hydrolase [Chloroflexota bacterium]